MESETRINEINSLETAVRNGDAESAVGLVRQWLNHGMSSSEILLEMIYPLMKEMSDAFSRLEIYLPELMKAAVCVHRIQEDVLLPEMRRTGESCMLKARVVIGTCSGDIHEVGKSMVSMLLRINGFDVYDLGTSVKTDDFVNAAIKNQAEIIALSSMLTTSLPYVKNVIDRLETLGIRNRFRIVVGGAAVNSEWASLAGLDGFGRDAIEAVDICNKLIDSRSNEGRR